MFQLTNLVEEAFVNTYVVIKYEAVLASTSTARLLRVPAIVVVCTSGAAFLEISFIDQRSLASFFGHLWRASPGSIFADAENNFDTNNHGIFTLIWFCR